MIPNITQGTDEHQRIGDRIKPIRANTIWSLYLSDFTTDVFDVTLNIVVVTVKGAQTQTALPNLPVGQFLKVGDGTNCDPVGFTPVEFLTLVNKYRVNDDQYTLKKWFKRRICKGAGLVSGAAGLANSSPTAGQGLATIQYRWTPPQLKYNNAADVTPTNHYPVYLIWATANNGTALTGNLNFNCRSELYFKDA